jgi:hypothetical protein
VNAPPHVEARWAQRDARLAELSFATYGDYLKSSCWARTKRRFRASQMPQECICGDDEVHLHHMTYERLGAESLSDLIALCRRCHEMVHELERRGVIGLGLEGLTLDEERAALGRAFLAQEVKRLERERAAALRETQAQVVALPFAVRVVRAAKAAEANRRDPRREVWFIGRLAHKQRFDPNPSREKFLTTRLRVLEEKAYGWDGWAAELSEAA